MIVFGVSTATVVGGVVTFLYGMRGRRIGATPACPRCEYPTTKNDETSTCPECGLLVTPENVVHGQKHRKKAHCVVGTIVFLIGLSLLSASLAPGRIYPLLPFRLVLTIATRGNVMAFNEIDLRVNNTELTPTQYRKLAEECLDRIDATETDDPEMLMWTRLLSKLENGGNLTAEERARFLARAAESVKFEPPQHFGVGELIKFKVQCRITLPGPLYNGTFQSESVWIDGRQLKDDEYQCQGVLGTKDNAASITCTLRNPLEPGMHDVRLDTTLILPRSNHVWSKRMRFESRFSVTGDLKAVALAEPLIISDQELRSMIKVFPTTMYSDVSVRAPCATLVSLLFELRERCPVGCAFECVAVVGNDRVAIGSFACKANTSEVEWVLFENQDWFGVQKVKVVLEPDQELATREGIYQYFPYAVPLGEYFVGCDS